MMASKKQEFTRDEVKKHNTAEDCWITIRKKVYAFPLEFVMESHPGGPVMLEAAGKDGTILFEDGPHGDPAREILEEYRIGVLKKDEEAVAASTAVQDAAAVEEAPQA